MPKRFTEEEIENIKYDYFNGMSLCELSKKYKRKSEIILAKLKSIGIYKYKNSRWTPDEIEFLKNNYSKASWDDLLSKLNRHSKENIISKASKLNIKRAKTCWTKYDIDVLKKGYREKASICEIREMLNNKFSDSAITSMASKLGVVKVSKWSDDEINTLLLYYSKMPLDDVCKLLPYRNKENIKAKAHKLNLKSYEYLKRHWTSEELLFLNTHYTEMSDDELADKLNRSVDSIRGKRDILKLLRPVEKGVYVYLSEYIRKRNKKWKLESIRKSNFVCVVTNGRFHAVHHLYSMNLILQEALNELNFNVKNIFSGYTDDELTIILNKFLEVQDRYPLGICLCDEIHKDFHNKYGYGNNTPEQFEQYLKENNYKIA